MKTSSKLYLHDHEWLYVECAFISIPDDQVGSFLFKNNPKRTTKIFPARVFYLEFVWISYNYMSFFVKQMPTLYVFKVRDIIPSVVSTPKHLPIGSTGDAEETIHSSQFKAGWSDVFHDR